MGKEAKKTKQIGVRFDKDLLEGVVKGGLADSPQRALNLYEKSYIELVELRVDENNKPENKKEIEGSRNTPNEAKEKVELPLTENEATDAVKPESKLAKSIRESREKFLNNKK